MMLTWIFTQTLFWWMWRGKGYERRKNNTGEQKIDQSASNASIQQQPCSAEGKKGEEKETKQDWIQSTGRRILIETDSRE